MVFVDLKIPFFNHEADADIVTDPDKNRLVHGIV